MMLEEGGTPARLPMGSESEELRAVLSLRIGFADRNVRAPYTQPICANTLYTVQMKTRLRATM